MSNNRSNGRYRSLNLTATGVSVTQGPCRVTGYFVSNTGTATAYIKLYDKATAGTSGDTPVETWPLAAGAQANFGVPFESGIPFWSGFSLRATSVLADNDTTDPTASTVQVNFRWAVV